MHHAYMNQQKYGECVDEYKTALMAIGRQRGGVIDDGTVAAAFEELPPEMPPISKPSKDDSNLSVQSKRGIEHSGSGSSIRDETDDKENVPAAPPLGPRPMASAEYTRTLDKQISVKEATKKFNRIASEEEANKITSPPAKKKPEKVSTVFLSAYSIVFNCDRLGPVDGQEALLIARKIRQRISLPPDSIG